MKTNQEKIELLQKMRGLIESNVVWTFCASYAIAVFGNRNEYRKVSDAMLEEIGLFKPKEVWKTNLSGEELWYGDKLTRLAKIDEAIKSFQLSPETASELEQAILEAERLHAEQVAGYKEKLAKLPKEPRIIWYRECSTSREQRELGQVVYEQKDMPTGFGKCCSFTQFKEVKG